MRLGADKVGLVHGKMKGPDKDAVMADKGVAKYLDPKTLPFDGKRMIWGGFKEIVGY